jgi:hypothetical protein
MPFIEGELKRDCPGLCDTLREKQHRGRVLVRLVRTDSGSGGCPG